METGMNNKCDTSDLKKSDPDMQNKEKVVEKYSNNKLREILEKLLGEDSSLYWLKK